MPRKVKQPSLLLHKATGQAYAKAKGRTGQSRTFYFGKYDTPEANAAYARFVVLWRLGILPPAEGKDENVTKAELAIYQRLGQAIEAVDKAKEREEINTVGRRNIQNTLGVIANNAELFALQMVANSEAEAEKWLWSTVRDGLRKAEGLSERAISDRCKKAKEFWNAAKDSRADADDAENPEPMAEPVS